PRPVPPDRRAPPRAPREAPPAWQEPVPRAAARSRPSPAPRRPPGSAPPRSAPTLRRRPGRRLPPTAPASARAGSRRASSAGGRAIRARLLPPLPRPPPRRHRERPPSCGSRDANGRRACAVEALRDDLGDPVGRHRDAVEDIRGLDRAFLVCDDDELGPVGEAPQQRDEPPDVRVVERRLHLVEQVERTRPREEEREEERDRPERLLAAGEQREPRDPLTGRLELDLDAGLFALLAFRRHE